MDLVVASEEEMTALGARMAPVLRRGDCLLLRGDLGVGKSTFARGLIRALAGSAIDVPSPSFSLVETYEMDIPVHHVDLYRLDGFEQVFELGLEDLIEDGITLVEWPEQAAALFPEDALTVRITEEGDKRKVTFEGQAERWAERLAPIMGQGG